MDTNNGTNTNTNKKNTNTDADTNTMGFRRGGFGLGTLVSYSQSHRPKPEAQYARRYYRGLNYFNTVFFLGGVYYATIIIIIRNHDTGGP